MTKLAELNRQVEEINKVLKNVAEVDGTDLGIGLLQKRGLLLKEIMETKLDLINEEPKKYWQELKQHFIKTEALFIAKDEYQPYFKEKNKKYREAFAEIESIIDHYGQGCENFMEYELSRIYKQVIAYWLWY